MPHIGPFFISESKLGIRHTTVDIHLIIAESKHCTHHFLGSTRILFTSFDIRLPIFDIRHPAYIYS